MGTLISPAPPSLEDSAQPRSRRTRRTIKAGTRSRPRPWRPLAREGDLFAEVTYNHYGRSANAGLRPVLFRHEIELPGDKGSPGVEALPLNDLVVRYDSASKRLVLRSLSRRFEVIPVLSSGVNPVGFVSDLVHIGRQGWQNVGYLPGFESAAWFAIVAPPKTPAAIVDKINADVNEALRERDIRERLAQLSAEPIGGTPQATAAYMREEIERWAKVIKAANVKLD